MIRRAGPLQAGAGVVPHIAMGVGERGEPAGHHSARLTPEILGDPQRLPADLDRPLVGASVFRGDPADVKDVGANRLHRRAALDEDENGEQRQSGPQPLASADSSMGPRVATWSAFGLNHARGSYFQEHQYNRIGSWKLAAPGKVNRIHRKLATAGSAPLGTGPPRTPRLRGTLAPAERAGQSKSPGLFRILGEGGAGQGTPAFTLSGGHYAAGRYSATPAWGTYPSTFLPCSMSQKRYLLLDMT